MGDLVSVIVPAYNVEMFIGRCLDSILAQTYSNIEIVVVDDGSIDHTSDICDDYRRKYPHQVRVFHVPNGGVIKARKLGMIESKGKWIGFVDGDDIIEPEMYEKLLANALQHHVDISHCGYQMVFSKGRVHYFYNTKEAFALSQNEGISELLSGRRIEPGICNKLYKRELIERLLNDSRIDENIKINEDLLMNFFLFSYAQKSYYEDFCPYHYMVRYESASRQKLNINKIYDPIKVKRIIMQCVSEGQVREAHRAYIITLINTYNSLVCSSEPFEKEKREIRSQIIEEKAAFNLLNKRTRLLACLMYYMPTIYPLLYQIYSKYFQKHPYD
ncbi:MAG: glycosyltransferase [Lachnospiraceae bacterium]|nr:glycosyltransferase [Lachnospiraceae bacterium]